MLAAGVLFTPSLGGLAPPPPLPPPASPPPAAIADCGAAPLPRDGVDSTFTALWKLPRQGWTGGDGTFSVALPDGSIAWAFGDTVIGGIAPDGRRDETSKLVRNSIVVQSGNCLSTLVGGSAEAPSSTIPADGTDRWFWPAQPFVEGGALRIPVSRIVQTGAGRWDFAFAGSEIATLRPGDQALESLRPIAAGSPVAWGAAVVGDGDFSYVFGGLDSTKELFVARAPREHVSDGAWSYWDGAAWSDAPDAAAPVLGGVSDQLSVLRDATGWALVSQRTGFSPEIAVWRAPAPEGPWAGGVTIATVPVPPGAVSYNAVLHPELGTDGGLLLSSNLAPADAADLGARPDLYRATWIRVAIPASV
jgi:Domain of unknown function (DUF4185)/Domain of unknown function (DUF5005)